MTMEFDLKEYLKWATSDPMDIEIHPSIEIRKSYLGGYGIFAKESFSKDIHLIKVPKHSTYFIDSLVDYKFMLEDLLHKEIVKSVLDAALTSGGSESETIIVRSYVWGLTILSQMTDVINEYTLKFLKPYLDFLRMVQVLDIDELVKSSDGVIKQLIAEKGFVRRDYTKFVEAYPKAKELLSFETALQLHRAVTSRVMEVPLYESQYEKYDFIVHTSLVPVLDFANHSSDNNAVLELDTKNVDVVLYLEQDVEAGDEITMKYDPVQKVNNFVRTYGFVPSKPRIFKWEIPDWQSFVKEANGGRDLDYARMASRLLVKPEIVVKEDKEGNVTFNTRKFLLPLLLIPGLVYHEAGIHDVPDGAGQDLDNLTLEDVREAVYYNMELVASGVHYDGKAIDLVNIIALTGTSKEDALELLVARTVEMLRQIGASPRPRVGVRAPNSETTYNGGVEQYETERESLLTKLFSMPDEQLAELVRESIVEYRYVKLPDDTESRNDDDDDDDDDSDSDSEMGSYDYDSGSGYY